MDVIRRILVGHNTWVWVCESKGKRIYIQEEMQLNHDGDIESALECCCGGYTVFESIDSAMWDEHICDDIHSLLDKCFIW